jgi:trehalose 6-phosphate synthase
VSAQSGDNQPRLVTVSNRVAIPKSGGAAAGGLAVGIMAALEEHGGMWFGWNGKLTDTESQDAQLTQQGNIEFATIALNAKDYEHYYNGYSNRVLWPVCHYLLNFMYYESGDLEGYRRVNTVFARKLIPLLKPNDVIWVHDYHLIPLASELRAAGVRNPIGFFLHVPFPSYEAFRAVPGHDFLLRSLCAYDVVGFQTRRDLACFRSAVAEPVVGASFSGENTVEVGGGNLIADVFPIGVDVAGIQSVARETADSPAIKRMTASLGNRRLVIGVDRLDYSKGLNLRLLGYERLLERYPNSQEDLVLMQIAPPTRVGVRAYDEIRAELEQTAGRINGRFADIDWAPIRYLNKGVDRPRLMGLFRKSAIGLVTPIRDGMNLVAKEFLAAQDPDDPGVLVLSKLAGAAQELREAVIINPYDADNVADGIAAASTMPLAERQQRHAKMLATLERNDITAWRTNFVNALLDA